LGSTKDEYLIGPVGLLNHRRIIPFINLS